MISVKNGKFYYRLVTVKTDDYQIKLLEFLAKKGLSESEAKKVADMDFKTNSSTEVKQTYFDLNIRVADDEVILLFGMNMDSIEFNDFISGYFE